MRLIVINKKRLGVTIIIVGLMIVLLGFEARFEQKLKLAALVQSNISSLRLYSVLDNSFTYKLPSTWISTVRDLGSKEILYHSDFNSNDNKVHGIIEVWNFKQDLKSFLDSSREISSQQNVIRNYNLANIKINDRPGYLVTYEIKTGDNIFYKAYEYFLKEDGKFVRFSFFVKTSDFNESMPNIFKIITETYQYKG